MRIRIKTKLFLILMSSSLLIITGMFVFTRLSFERGLIRYMDKIQTQNMQTLCQVLGESYAGEGNWAFLKHSPDLWENIQRFSFRRWQHSPRRPMRRHSASPPPKDRRDYCR